MNTPALILLGAIALSLVVSYPMMSLAQEQIKKLAACIHISKLKA